MQELLPAEEGHLERNQRPLPVMNLLAQRAGPALAVLGLLGAGLVDTLGQDLGVLVLFRGKERWTLVKWKGVGIRWGLTYRLILDLLGLAALERNAVALVLQALGSDESLDLGSLGVRLLALGLGLDLTSDDVLADLYRERGEEPNVLVFSHIRT